MSNTLFSPYASFREEFVKQTKRGVFLEPAIVAKIGSFVVDAEHEIRSSGALTTRPSSRIHGSTLSRQMRETAQQLIADVEDAFSEYKNNQTPDFKDQVIVPACKRFREFLQECKKQLEFFEKDYMTSGRNIDFQLRRAFTFYRSEMNDILPGIIEDMDRVDKIYSVHFNSFTRDESSLKPGKVLFY